MRSSEVHYDEPDEVSEAERSMRLDRPMSWVRFVRLRRLVRSDRLMSKVNTILQRESDGCMVING